MGYHRAGFTDIVGVDIEPQKNYPFRFVLDDALAYLRHIIGTGEIAQFDLIHASPPCQRFSVATLANGNSHTYPDFVGATRRQVKASGTPYVIENVPRAPLENPLMLCGTMFAETRVRRHRLFECWPEIWFPPAACNHNYGRIPRAGYGANAYGYISVAGNFTDVDSARDAMNIDWMTRDELAQAIPPAYTEYIGKQMMSALRPHTAATRTEARCW